MTQHTIPARQLRMRAAAALALMLLAVAASACGSSNDEATAAGTTAAKGPVKVAVLQIAPIKVLDDTVAAFERRLQRDMAPRKVTFDLKNAQGDPSLIQSIVRDLRSSDADAIAVIGTPAVIAMAKVEKRRPLFAIAMGDPVGSGVARSLDAPGGNVTGSIDFLDPAKLLDVIGRTQPAPKRIGTIYDPSNQNSQVWVDALDKAAGASGVRVVKASVGGARDVPAAARSLVGRADAILIGPDTAANTALAAIAATARARKLALYLAAGDASTAGVLASLGPSYPTIGEQTGDVAAKVLEGGDPARTPFARPASIAPDVNAATAKALGLALPSDLKP
jgi:putative tryptophan/tyrosine transport system substrate-binding protein